MKNMRRIQAAQRAVASLRKVAGAFTLIELLVVISIVALLMAILLPVLARARLMAKSTQCRNNLHEEGIDFWAKAADGTRILGDVSRKEDWPAWMRKFRDY